MPSSESKHNASYLQVMGIQAWALRTQPIASVVEDVVEKVAMDVSENTGLTEALDELPVEVPVVVNKASESAAEVDVKDIVEITDVSQLDWSTLESAVSSCTACVLHESRTNTVFGVGDHNAQIMVIGEAPGADEDQQGEPFIGAAGQLLNNMLLAIGYKHEQVYIANILKCRPPDDRDPQLDEVFQCELYLKRQIAMVKPKVILAVGRIAAHNLMKVETPIGKMRGKLYQYGDTPVVVTYHPAYLLRKPSEKAKSWDDLRLALSIIHTDENSKNQELEKEELQ